MALSLVLLFFAVNLATGPGVPSIVNGRPTLAAHGTIHYTTWALYWLNDALMALALTGVVGAFIVTRLRPFRPTRAEAPSEPTTALLLERRINAWINGRRYALAVDVEVRPDQLELRRSGSSDVLLLVAISDIPVVWFVRGRTGWTLLEGDQRREFSTFQLYPWSPRRWFQVLSQLRVPIRPEGMQATRLPSVQVGLLAQTGCLVALILAAVVAIGLSLLPSALSVVKSLGL